MNRRIHWCLFVALVAATVFNLRTAIHAQDGCANALPPRLVPGESAQVLFVDGQPLNVRSAAGRSSPRVGQIPEGARFQVLKGPVCADGLYWWEIQTGQVTGWIAESDGSKYFVEPVSATSATTPPSALALPPTYRGKLPLLPVALGSVLFVNESKLDAAQRSLLAKNGFVVVPAGLRQFDDAYRFDWDNMPMYPPRGQVGDETSIAQPMFVTTDSMLHALHYVFDNLLTDLERQAFEPRMEQVVAASLEAAQAQAKAAAGTPLEQPAQTAVLYLAIAQELFAPGTLDKLAAPDITEQARRITSLALDASGQIELPFLKDYKEDFSQYRPRGHYAGDETLERYFRGMMWLSRITFRAKEASETQTALLLLRALRSGTDAYAKWQTVHDMLSFLIGPVDDLGPSEYGPLADQVFGADLALNALADDTRLASFRDAVAKLPGPRVNGLVLPPTVGAENVERETKGFRFLGQRFTFDAYVMQQLIMPYVGDLANPRYLPLGLDVAAVMGSETAYALAKEAGATSFANYEKQVGLLRGQLASLTTDRWLENIYGGWLWTLQPLWKRDTKPYPPLMQTEAWLRKDLHTGLASWTELKHDTILYVKQPTGFGGGGPPLYSYGYVEPNPLVFERIATVAALTYAGIKQRGFYDEQDGDSTLAADMGELNKLAVNARSFAMMALKELRGEALTDDEYFAIQEVGTYLDELLRTLYQGDGQPDPVALVTDVANNPIIGQVLQEGVGGVDYIYVVIPGPKGLQLARGGVFSYYEFTNDINKRMTDQEWRALVDKRQLPPRPEWVNAFLSGKEPTPTEQPAGR